MGQKREDPRYESFMLTIQPISQSTRSQPGRAAKRHPIALSSEMNEISRATLIDRTAAHIRQKFSGESSGHDWWHIYRVWQNAKQIAGHEPAEMLIVELGALLHDIADWKFSGDDAAGPRDAAAWLRSEGAPEAVVAAVCDIIKGLSYKGAHVAIDALSLEGRIVQDADRLDAIGAIGVGRAFAYGGHAGREMHNPDVPPVLHGSYEAYKKNKGPTINHFYEKLLLLKDRMNTETGKRIAERRHEFLEQFLGQFLNEFDGRDFGPGAV